MSQNGKLMPNLDQQGTKVLNLTVLQRIDQFVEEILITAAHVTFYEFNIDSSQWSRKDVEGSLFVVKRNVQPRFQFIVMNRRSEDNLVENLLGDFEYEVQVPYLLYRNASQEVNGIWFYNPRECEEVANLFSRILSAYAKVPTKLKMPSGKSEFGELEAVPTMSVMDGPLEPSSATTSDVRDAPDDRLFMNFFGAAMNLGSGTSGTLVPPHPPSVPPAVPPNQIPTTPLSASNVFKPLLGNPEDGHLSRTANLVKPSSFFNPPSSSSLMVPPATSSMPTAPPLDPSGNLQRQYGTPLLQPFPPPTPSPSLTPIAPPATNYGPVISKDKVRDALLMLAQDDQFIDIVYRALLNAHHS